MQYWQFWSILRYNMQQISTSSVEEVDGTNGGDDDDDDDDGDRRIWNCKRRTILAVLPKGKLPIYCDGFCTALNSGAVSLARRKLDR